MSIILLFLTLYLFLLSFSSLSTLLSPYFYLSINCILSFTTIRMMKDQRCGNIRHQFPTCPFPPLLTPQAYFIFPGLLQPEQQRSNLAGKHPCHASRHKTDEGCQKGPSPLAKLFWEAVILQLEQGEGWLWSAFHPAITKCSAVIGKFLYLCDTDGEVETNHWVL